MILTLLIIQPGQLFLCLNIYLHNARLIIHQVIMTRVHPMIHHHLGHLMTGVVADLMVAGHQIVGEIKKVFSNF